MTRNPGSSRDADAGKGAAGGGSVRAENSLRGTEANSRQPSPPAEIRIRPLRSPHRRVAVSVVGIYHEAFPASQRVADEMLLRFVPHPQEEPGGWVFHVAESPEGVAGFAVGLHVSSMSLAYLAYLAVAAGWREHGVGSSLFRSVIAHWSRLRPKPPHWVFLEVERPELAEDDAERHRRERRIRFYERLGCRRVRADFQAPPLGPSLPVVPYWILMRPIRDPDLRPPAVRAALADIYREVYGLDEDHPLVENCLQSVR